MGRAAGAAPSASLAVQAQSRDLTAKRDFVPRYQWFESTSLQRRGMQTIGSSACGGAGAASPHPPRAYRTQPRPITAGASRFRNVKCCSVITAAYPRRGPKAKPRPLWGSTGPISRPFSAPLTGAPAVTDSVMPSRSPTVIIAREVAGKLRELARNDTIARDPPGARGSRTALRPPRRSFRPPVALANFLTYELLPALFTAAGECGTGRRTSAAGLSSRNP